MKCTTPNSNWFIKSLSTQAKPKSTRTLWQWHAISILTNKTCNRSKKMYKSLH